MSKFFINFVLALFSFKQIGSWNPAMQILSIVVFVVITFITQRKEYRATGKTYGRYPWRISTFISTIHEEIIFRGFFLFGLLTIVSPLWSIIISSALFGLWHLKNSKWQSFSKTVSQVLYTGLVVGPVLAILALSTGTVWLAIIVHYIHNIFADTYRRVETKNRFILISNIFLVLPVIFASIYHQWLYCFFASGLYVFSPLFHWCRINSRRSYLFQVFKFLDWSFAICAFVYMYYYVASYTCGITEATLLCMLSLVVIFFWYGWKRADYGKYHPWFHIVAPIVSSLILIFSQI